MKAAPRKPVPLKDHDSVLNVKISEELFETPASAAHRGHRRSHTRRLFIQLVGLSQTNFEDSQCCPKPSQQSPDFTDLNSFPSTTIESEGSGSEGMICRANSRRSTASIVSPKAVGSADSLTRDLKASMNAILREDCRQLQRRQAVRSSMKQYIVQLMQQQRLAGNSMAVKAGLDSPSQKRRQQPGGRLFKY
jgi:hypothetical protein